jgi:glycosyltransferase involved in cell wall biosynthesis
MQKPYLTIAITTYNRCEFLRDTLKFLLDETSALLLEDLVEIIVIDNGSKDDTFEALQAFDSIPNFSFSKNQNSIDVSKNILNLIHRSRGDYFWCYGDDDLVPHGTIKRIVDYLRKTAPNHLLLDRQDFYDLDEIDLREVSLTPVHYQPTEIRQEFNRFDRLFSFITSNIYSRAHILQVFERCIDSLENNYTNKYAAWLGASAGGLTFIEGPIAFKRCSIGQGSHFNENLDLKLKTFIFDQVKIAKALEQTDTKLAEYAFNKYLSDYRSLAKYKIGGADIVQIIRNLKSIGVPQSSLRTLKLISVIPTSLLKAGIAYRAYRRGRH